MNSAYFVCHLLICILIFFHQLNTIKILDLSEINTCKFIASFFFNFKRLTLRIRVSQ